MTKSKDEQEKEEDGTIHDFLIERHVPELSFSNIGGMEDVKEKMTRVIDFSKVLMNNNIPFEYPGKILLYGPPGCGKTLLASAISGELGWPMYELRLSKVISSFLGLTQKNMAKIFDHIKKVGITLKEKEKKGIVFFMDEFDYLAKDRGDKEEMGEMKRLVNVILKEFDELNFSKNCVLTICATNHQTMLDSAVWRRFNIVCKIGMPNERERKSIISLFLIKFRELGIQLAEEESLIENLVSITANSSGSEIKRDIDGVIIHAITDQIKSLSNSEFIAHLEESRSESLYNIFIKDKEIQVDPSLSFFSIPGEVNPVLFDDLLRRQIMDDEKYKNIVSATRFFDELDESTKKLLISLNFYIFYQPNAQKYVMALKKEMQNRGDK